MPGRPPSGLSNALSSLNGRFHTVVGQVRTDDELYSGIGHPPGSEIYHDLLDRRIYRGVYHRLGDHLRRKTRLSRAIVVSPEELPGFCFVDGTGLTPNGRRAVAARPSERTGLPLPPAGQLARYRGPGLPLCRPLTHDRQPYDGLVAIAPSLQTRHLVVLGATGAGKSVSMTGAMLGNARTTPGASILFDLKGDGMANEYLMSHYAAWGSLEDVTYFDLTNVLPALSFFDIGPLLDAGVPREEATARKAGHYEEILKGVMGTERFEQAVVSPQVIATHVKALFDPVHGSDAFSHRDLLEALYRTQTKHAGPPVSDDDLERHFESLVEDDPRMFTNVMAGARTRVERIGLDRRLAPVFNHVPTSEHTDEPQFDFADFLDSDHVLVFDFGDMEAAAKRTLTLVLLSALWSALRARAANQTNTNDDRPVVNLFLEEAASVCDTELVDTLLSQGRSFGLSVTLGLQFLGQLRTRSSRTYFEVLNETASFLCGNVAVDADLAAALATDAMPPAEVENRLRALGPGEWLVRLGAQFAEATPRTFLGTSLPAPPGHSASTEPLGAPKLPRSIWRSTTSATAIPPTTASSIPSLQRSNRTPLTIPKPLLSDHASTPSFRSPSASPTASASMRTASPCAVEPAIAGTTPTARACAVPSSAVTPSRPSTTMTSRSIRHPCNSAPRSARPRRTPSASSTSCRSSTTPASSGSIPSSTTSASTACFASRNTSASNPRRLTSLIEAGLLRDDGAHPHRTLHRHGRRHARPSASPTARGWSTRHGRGAISTSRARTSSASNS
ncbi:MAG: hypothetical protein U5J98_06025 [Halobacteriales archaeon]|nr:hypothetical protein [Halobacteriales archaeon]